jgi:alanine dehydrogenase
MNIGLLKEIKSSEQRILLTPPAVQQLVEAGNEVFVESGGGTYSNFNDTAYESAGAKILPTSEKVFKNAELILKVQAPTPIEYELYEPHHISFSFLHLSVNRERINALLKRKSVFFAAEMIENNEKSFPILRAMSEIAGKMAINQAAKYLEFTTGGKGILITGTKTVPAARITIIGAGTAGSNAAIQAVNMGCSVNLLDADYLKLLQFKEKLPATNLEIFEFSRAILREILIETDVLITAVQVPGQRAPILVKKEDVKLLHPGSIIIDLSIDQGGCVETSHATTAENPIYKYEEIVHFCVSNLPSAVPNTSSQALSNAVFPYIKPIAQLGCEEAIALNSELRSGLCLYKGKLVNKKLAEANNMERYDILELLEISI